MYRFIVELCLQLKIRGGKFVMEAQSRTMQCNLQDLGLSRAESGLRRILQDCRTFGGHGFAGPCGPPPHTRTKG